MTVGIREIEAAKKPEWVDENGIKATECSKVS